MEFLSVPQCQCTVTRTFSYEVASRQILWKILERYGFEYLSSSARDAVDRAIRELQSGSPGTIDVHRSFDQLRARRRQYTLVQTLPHGL